MGSATAGGHAGHTSVCLQQLLRGVDRDSRKNPRGTRASRDQVVPRCEIKEQMATFTTNLATPTAAMNAEPQNMGVLVANGRDSHQTQACAGRFAEHVSAHVLFSRLQNTK